MLLLSLSAAFPGCLYRTTSRFACCGARLCLSMGFWLPGKLSFIPMLLRSIDLKTGFSIVLAGVPVLLAELRWTWSYLLCEWSCFDFNSMLLDTMLKLASYCTFMPCVLNRSILTGIHRVSVWSYTLISRPSSDPFWLPKIIWPGLSGHGSSLLLTETTYCTVVGSFVCVVAFSATWVDIILLCPFGFPCPFGCPFAFWGLLILLDWVLLLDHGLHLDLVSLWTSSPCLLSWGWDERWFRCWLFACSWFLWVVVLLATLLVWGLSTLM